MTLIDQLHLGTGVAILPCCRFVDATSRGNNMWDATQYLKYADERSRPFFDLLARVTTKNGASAVDLGCCPGNLTRTLTERWPSAQVVGVDNSPEMLEKARSHAVAGRLEFVQADIASWTADKPVDLVVS